MMTSKDFLLMVAGMCLVTTAYGVGQECVEISTEVNFKIEDVEGNWYPMEIVLHRNDSKIYGVPIETQCPVVTFTVNPKNRKVLMMLWNGTDGDVEYKFTQKGGSKSGQWQAIGDQTGIRAAILAVGIDKYMIIRLCSTATHNTVLLSKYSSRSQDVINAANNDLAKMVKYPSIERKPLCNNSADISKQLSTTMLISSISILVLLLRQ